MAVTRIWASCTAASLSSTTLPWMRPVCASAGTASASIAPAIHEVSVRRPSFPENISVLHNSRAPLELRSTDTPEYKESSVNSLHERPACLYCAAKNRRISAISRVIDGRRQRRQKPPSVPHRLEPRIEHRQHAAIVTMANQAAQPLQQRRGWRAAPDTRRTAGRRGRRSASIRAAVIGSPGDANGSLSMMTQLSASPITSTPCQKLDVASSTAFGVVRN